MFCPKCGEKIKHEKSKFCTKCGFDLSQQEIVQPKPVLDNYQKNTTYNNNTNTTNNNNYNNTADNSSNSSINVNKNILFLYALIPIVIIVIFVVVLYSASKSEIDDDSVYESLQSGSNNSKYGSDKYDSDEYDNEYFTEEPETETTTHEPRYDVYVSDVTWTEAFNDCAARGGHLVTIDSAAEYSKVVSIISAYSDKNVYYVGAGRSYDDYNYYWLDKYGYSYGDSINNLTSWLSGEPTFYDSSSGLDETCVCMFYHSSSGSWVFNDIPNDYLSVASYKTGRIAYICEFD